MLTMASTSEPEDSAEVARPEEAAEVNLSDAQRARIERNRQKALLLRQARLASRPYSLDKQAR